MDVWRYKITQDPRQGFEELQQQVPVYERANNLLDKMLQLDTSLGGEEKLKKVRNTSNDGSRKRPP